MNLNLVWEEPAEKPKKKSKNEQLFDILTENPGRWARIGTAKNSKAAGHRVFQIRDQAKKYGVGHFEFTARKLNNNQGAIYGRFLGDSKTAAYDPYDKLANEGFVVTT